MTLSGVCAQNPVIGEMAILQHLSSRPPIYRDAKLFQQIQQFCSVGLNVC
jgi:hypothetical protein